MNSFKYVQKKYISIILTIPLLLVLFTVSIVNNSMANPTVSAKYVWFGITLVLSTICSFLLLLLNKRKIKLSIIDCLLSVFIFWGIVLTYYKCNDFAFNLYILLLLWIFYAVCRITIEQFNFCIPIFLFILLMSGLLEAVWGLGQLYGYYFSQHNSFVITGSFYNPGPYGGYLSLILPIALYYILLDYSVINQRRNRNNIMIYIRWGISLLTLLAIILILPATMSRASWIATFCGCSLIIVHYKSRKNRNLFCFLQNNKKVLLGSILSICIAFLGVYYMKKDSADGRFFIWKNSITTMLDNPNGVGVGYFPGAYGKVQANYFVTQFASEQEQFVAGSPEYAFNEYLQIGVEFGSIPLLFFASIIVLTFYVGYKYKRYPAIAGLLTLLIFAMMSYPFNLLPFLIVLLVFIALCLSSCEENERKMGNSLILCYSVIIIVFLLIVGTSIYRYRSLKEAYIEWNKIRMLNNIDLGEKHIIEYEKIYPFLRHESVFLFEYAKYLNKIKKYEESNQILKEMGYMSCDPMVYNIMGRNYQAMKNYREAEKAYQMASFLVPSRLYPYYLLTKLYDETGERDKIFKIAKIVLIKKVKIHSEATNEMRKEIHEICCKYQSN